MSENIRERYTGDGLLKISENIIEVIISDYIKSNLNGDLKARFIDPILERIKLENSAYYKLIQNAIELYREEKDKIYLGNVTGLILGYEVFKRQSESNNLEDSLGY